MTCEKFAKLVDELIEAAKYVQSCQDILNHTDGYVLHNQRNLELADRELLELREQLLTFNSQKPQNEHYEYSEPQSDGSVRKVRNIRVG